MKKRPFYLFAAVWMCLTVRPALAQQGTIAQPSAQSVVKPAEGAKVAGNGASAQNSFPGWLMTGKEKRYTTANTHSHNDYEQSIPFRSEEHTSELQSP